MATAGPKRRVATRKRTLNNNDTSTERVKKLKCPQVDKHTYSDNSAVQNGHHPTSAVTEPLQSRGVFLTDQRDEGQSSSARHIFNYNTPTKLCSRSEIGSIQHKKPLFRPQGHQSKGLELHRDSATLKSKFSNLASKKTEQICPMVHPGKEGSEEDSRSVTKINSEYSQSAHPAIIQCHASQNQGNEVQDSSFNSSLPLPPTPRGPCLKHPKTDSSLPVINNLPMQRDSILDWDEDDSFYDKLDIVQLVANSQNSDRLSDGSPHVRVGDCPKYAENVSPRSQAHHESGQEGHSKCSIASKKVLTNGFMHVPGTSKGDVCVQPHQFEPHSETPKPEKWFSHIVDKTKQNLGKCSDDQKELTLDCQSQVLENELLVSELQSCHGDALPNASLNQPDELNFLPIKQAGMDGPAKAALNQFTSTPKLTSASSRLRQRLQQNAQVVTPQLTRHSELRQAKVQEALTEMLEETHGNKDNDIGPFYGLPSKVAELLKTHRGIEKLYDWQHSCLSLPALQEGRNLIYSLPTSGGKTLVAEILIMRQLLCNKKDALLILPYVSIVQEKVASLSTFAVELGFLVEEYAGSKGAIPPRKRRKKKTLYVATIEKAHSLVNSLILEGRAESLGLVVVDELHMLGDGGRRGASLEACITKLLYLNFSHLIGMSATLSNIQDLCEFLRAEVYSSDFRPVELKEYMKIEDNIYEVNQSALCPDDRFTHSRVLQFPYTATMRRNDPDHLVGLALEVIPTFSCLIFCATKKSCQNVAEFICKHMPKEEAQILLRHKNKEKHVLLLSLRRECDNHLCPTLKRTIPYGFAYHHSGLTMDERKLIEDAYSEGTLCLLTCTSTLAAGVNLPAKRVILRSPYIGQDLLTSTRYKQMVGRAGRAGIDSSGESILIIKPKERQQIADLLSRPIESCYSSLTHDEGKGLRSLILTLIALKLTSHRSAVLSFMKQTLFGIQASKTGKDTDKLAEESLRQLLEANLVREVSVKEFRDASEPDLTVTKLGQAAFKGSIDIDLCSSIYDDLRQACDEGLVLANTLHLLYLVTPYDLVANSNPNWAIYDRLYSKLSESNMRVAELVGVTDRYLNFKLAGRKANKPNATADFHVRRFYLTLMLWMILNQESIWDVSAKFDVPRGFVQNLFSSAASFGSSVQRFCEDLPEFWAYQQLLTKVVYDLTYCATADLVSLLEVPGVKQGRAKQLVRAGYKTLRHLAHADANQLTREVEHLPKKVAQQIVAAAKMELDERAEALREEADQLVTKPSPEDLVMLEAFEQGTGNIHDFK